MMPFRSTAVSWKIDFLLIWVSSLIVIILNHLGGYILPINVINDNQTLKQGDL